MKNATEQNTKFWTTKILTYVSILMLLLLTVLLWHNSKKRNELELRTYIDDRASESTELIKRNFDSYFNILYGMRSLFASNRTIDRSEWKKYVQKLNLEQSYPGILSVEFTRLVENKDKRIFEETVRKDKSINDKGYPDFRISPPGDRKEYYVVDFVEPMGSEKIFGLDRAVSPVSRTAIKLLLDSDKLAVSEQIPLIRRNNQPGFIIMLPIYKNGMAHDSVEQRRKAFMGFVSMTIYIEDFMKDLFRRKYASEFNLKLYEDILIPGSPLASGSYKLQLLYDSDKAFILKNGICNIDNCITKTIELPNRHWDLFFSVIDKSKLVSKNMQPLLILVMGISITLFVSVMILVINNSERRAVKLAETMVTQLWDRNEQLQNLHRDWETTFNSMDDGIVILGKENEILDSNEAFNRIMGDKRGEIIGQNCFEVFHNAKEPILNCPFKKVKETGHTERAEIFEPSLNKWFAVTVSPVFDNNGALLKVIHVIRDISERKKADDKIREDEVKYRSIVDNSSDQIFMIDTDYKYISVNEALADILRKSTQEIVGMTVSEIYPATVAAAFTKNIKQVIDYGERVFLEEKMIVPGSDLFVSSSLNPVKDDKGKVIAVTGIVRDITSQKNIEEELIKVKKRLELAIEASHLGIWELDLIKDTTDRNLRHDQIFGYKNRVAEWGAKIFQEHIIPEDRPFVQIAFDGAMKNDKLEFEGRILWPDKSIHWIVATGNTIRDGAGKPIKIFGSVADITERKKMEDTLRESAAELSELYNNAPFGYNSTDTDGTITRINDTALQWLGYTRDEVEGKMKIADLLTPASSKKVGELFPLLKEGGRGKIDNMELEMHKKDGSTFPALGNSMILRDKNGKFLMTRSSILDITEYTKIAEKLKNAMEVKSAFTSMVSHELRTPLASIKEGVGIVLDGSAGDINDEQKKFLELAKRNVDRLHRLINNVLDFTKFDAGKMIFNFKEEDLNKLVGELVNANEPALTKNGLYIETEFAGEMPFVILDADKISQVLSNLINNAEKFTIRGGIRVTTSYNSIRDEAVVKVIDTGQGISAEDIGKLFEKFTTVGSKRMMGSTGLGLAICKQIIQGHSGRIYAESELGKGSVFTFVLPVKGAKNA